MIPDVGEHIAKAGRRVEETLPHGATYALAGDTTSMPAVPGRRAMPMVEHDGVYWGAPESGAAARDELERAREAGAEYFVVPYFERWWFDYYPELHRHLRTCYRCVVDDDAVTVFDLSVADGRTD